MMMATLHSNGQQRTGKDEDTEKGCQNPALQKKITDDNHDMCNQLIHFVQG